MTAKLLTVAEVADVIQATPGHVYKLIRRGDLNARRLGRKMLRVSETDLEGYLCDASTTGESGARCSGATAGNTADPQDTTPPPRIERGQKRQFRVIETP